MGAQLESPLLGEVPSEARRRGLEALRLRHAPTVSPTGCRLPQRGRI